MCGIIGGTRKSWNYAESLNCIRYRGPDEARIEQFEPITLGFVRLAIRDLSSAAMQPMIYEDENNKKVALVFNGEIYGCESLRQELAKKGYHFTTASDTEVVLYAYVCYGEDFIQKLDGMFAIAIYNERKRKMILYRDRFGIKPLFFYYYNGEFAFASELKAIQQMCNDVSFERDNSALYDYFLYRYIPEPKTIFHHVWKLEPACKLTYSFNTKKIHKEKYWKLKVSTAEKGNIQRQEAEYTIRNLIAGSVKQQLISDVPVGTFLSGGIDSSIISAEISKCSDNFGAFSMGFEINRQERIYDETMYAQRVADKFGFPINVFQFSPENLKKNKEKILDWFDEPYADTSCYPTFEIAKHAKENGVTVILTGDGGDEVFGGYMRYTNCSQLYSYKQLLADIKTIVIDCNKREQTLWEIIEENFCFLNVFGDNAYLSPKDKRKRYRKFLGIDDDYDDHWYFRKFDHKELPPITRAQYIDLNTYLPADILAKVDRTAMRNSVETRVPLLSKEIVEYSFSLPQEIRCPDKRLKGLLIDAYRGVIPDGILNKGKKGFSFPERYWGRTEDSRFVLWNTVWRGRI